jgi:hypothetical protein
MPEHVCCLAFIEMQIDACEETLILPDVNFSVRGVCRLSGNTHLARDLVRLF